MGKPAGWATVPLCEVSQQGHAGLAEKGNKKSSKYLGGQACGSMQVGICLDCVTIENKRSAKKQHDSHLAISCRANPKHSYMYVSLAHMIHMISFA